MALEHESPAVLREEKRLTALVWRLTFFAWQAGNFAVVAIMAVIMIVGLATLPAELRPDWLTTIVHRFTTKPAHEADDQAATA